MRNQDDEYNYRLRKAGARLLLAEDVSSRYHSRASFRSLFKQYFQYGFWKVRVLQKHPRQMSARQFVPPAFVSAWLALLVAAPLLGPVPLLALTGLYAGLCAAMALTVAARAGWDLLPLLPVCFATLHVSYGSGFLTGLVRFHDRWGDVTGPSGGTSVLKRVLAWCSASSVSAARRSAVSSMGPLLFRHSAGFPPNSQGGSVTTISPRAR